MNRVTPMWIGVAFVALLVGGSRITWAQPAQTQQEKYSGGTQGLQEKLYEERLRELQQSQTPGSGQQPQNMRGPGSATGQSRSGDTRPSQGAANDRSEDAGRQTDQPVKR